MRLIDDGPRMAFGARVVDRHVDVTKTREGSIDERLNLIVAAHVAGDELGLGTERQELLRQRLPLLLVTSRDDELCALSGKGKRGRPPDAGERPSDENALFARAAHGHDSSLRELDVQVNGLRMAGSDPRALQQQKRLHPRS
jgi:hypothetical protein